MKKIQPVVEIYGCLHLHSQLFDSVEEAKESIKKNEAYTWKGFAEVTFEPYSEILEKIIEKALK